VFKESDFNKKAYFDNIFLNLKLDDLDKAYALDQLVIVVHGLDW